MKLLDKLLIIFLISLPIHRIDLANGKLAFVLTPVLLTSIVIIIFSIFYAQTKQKKSLPGGFSLFKVTLILIALWFAFTIIFLQDFVQLKRLILFYIIIASSISFFVLFNYSENKQKLIRFFVFGSLKVYYIFSIIHAVLFALNTQSEPIPFISLLPQTIGPYFPRLTGGFFDPNLAGYFLTFLYILIYQFKLDRKSNWIIVFLIFFTLSRSAIVAFIIIALIIKIYEFALKHEKIRFYFTYEIIKKFIRIALLFLCLITISFSILLFTNIGDRLGDALNARLFNEDNSTSIHLGLFNLAADKILDNPFNFLTGYGFGSSFLYTERYFPGNKYGNFHTELISIMFETGFVGLFLYLLLFILPLYLYIQRPLKQNFFLMTVLPAALLHGIFYQQYLFHYYWIMLGLVWYFLGKNLKDNI